jgi:peptide/nickel transport system substrate-binding protein
MLTRRSLLATAAAAAPASWPALAATPKGVVVIAGQIDDIVSFDPAESYEFTNGLVNANAYRNLVRPDLKDTNKVAGDLAESWTVSPDGKTFTFQLIKNAFFPSGKAVTAEDAAWSLQRAVILNKTPGFILTQFGFTKDNVEKLIRATGPNTLVLELPTIAATSFVLFCLGATIGAVVEKATVIGHDVNGDLGNAWLKNRTVGAGPYQLTSWAASDRVICDANPNSGIPVNNKRIIILHVKDPSAQLLMLQKGDADVALDLTPDQLKDVAKDPDVHIASSGQGTSMYLAMNTTVPPFAKIPVRQAIKWAIDYEAIAKNITPNIWVVSQAFLPKGLPGALTDTPFHKDVAKAKALLTEAGYPDGFEITLDHISSTPSSDIAQAIQADLGAIGIKVTLSGGEQKQVITKTRARQHQMALLSWGTDYFDPNSNAQAWCANPDDSDASKLKILAWRSHFADPELTAMVDAASKELDGEKRLEMYAKMQRICQDRAPFAWLLQRVATAVQGKGVSGYAVGPVNDFTRYGDVRKSG